MPRPKGLTEPIINKKCPYCLRTIRTRSGFNRHLSIGHPEVVLTEKACSRCEQVKPIQEFPPVSGSLLLQNGQIRRRAACYECKSKGDRTNISPEERTAAQRGHRRSWAGRRFGLTLEEYDEIFEALREKQGGKCPGCLRDLGEVEVIHLEHCHKTMKIRGLTCRTCNVTMGMAKDDPEILRRLANYLVDTAKLV